MILTLRASRPSAKILRDVTQFWMQSRDFLHGCRKARVHGVPTRTLTR